MIGDSGCDGIGKRGDQKGVFVNGFYPRKFSKNFQMPHLYPHQSMRYTNQTNEKKAYVTSSQPAASSRAKQYRFCDWVIKLPSVLDNLTDKNAILDVALDLLRNRALLGVLVGSLLGWQHDVHTGALAGEDLGVQTLLTQIDGSAVNLVQQDGRDHAVDLQRELGRLDHLKTADEGVDDDGEAVAVVNGDGVCFVRHLEDGLVTAGNQDGLVLLGWYLNDASGIIEVLDVPLVRLKLLARRFLRAHALRLGLLSGSGALGTIRRRRRNAAQGVAAIGDRRASTESGILVRHLRLVDLAEAGSNTLSLVYLSKDGGHVSGRRL